MKTSPARILAIIVLVAFGASAAGSLILANASDQNTQVLEVWVLLFLLGVSVPIAVVGFVLAIAGVGWMIVNIFTMTSHIKSGAGRFDWRLGFNPFNVIFFPQHLTEPGLVARQRILRGILIFLAGFLLVLPAVMVAERAF